MQENLSSYIRRTCSFNLNTVNILYILLLYIPLECLKYECYQFIQLNVIIIIAYIY